MRSPASAYSENRVALSGVCFSTNGCRTCNWCCRQTRTRLCTSTLGNQFCVVAFNGCHRLRTTWFVTNFVLCARSHYFLLPSKYGYTVAESWRIIRRGVFELRLEGILWMVFRNFLKTMKLHY